MCTGSLFEPVTLCTDLLVYEVAHSLRFFFDSETFQFLLVGFIWRRLEGKCERVSIVLVVDRGHAACRTDARQERD